MGGWGRDGLYYHFDPGCQAIITYRRVNAGGHLLTSQHQKPAKVGVLLDNFLPDTPLWGGCIVKNFWKVSAEIGGPHVGGGGV